MTHLLPARLKEVYTRAEEAWIPRLSWKKRTFDSQSRGGEKRRKRDQLTQIWERGEGRQSELAKRKRKGEKEHRSFIVTGVKKS